MFEKTEEFWYGNVYASKQVVICPLYYPNLTARIATDLVKHLAIAAAVEAGEDSAGRQKIRLQAPNEVALRACEIAYALMHEFNVRGWLQSAPLPPSNDDGPGI